VSGSAGGTDASVAGDDGGRPLRATVVLATYDERENVQRLLPELLRLDEQLGVVVVDDASPDGTAAAVEDAAAAFPGRVRLVSRPAKLGYGSALVAGFRKALEEDPDAVVSMDADFSHDPRALPDLLAGLAAHDVVIGSRYLGGIRILNWSLSRLLLSRAANFYVGLLLPSPITDRTSGYRAYRSQVLRSIDLEGAASNGYAFLVELLEMVISGGFSIGEAPIVYEDRQHGRSKMDRRVVFEAAWRPWVLLLRRVGAYLRRRR
jgi:dolichol-phosphate mannosyltransferase